MAYKVKYKGKDNVTARMTCTEDTTNLYSEEIVRMFFKMYNKLTFVNKLTVIVHGSYGGDQVLTNDPSEYE